MFKGRYKREVIKERQKREIEKKERKDRYTRELDM